MPQSYILTATGKYFNFLAPEDHEYDVEEIAHALSHICRYTGHCDKFYSVAQHSVLVSRVLPKPFKRAGLLHDRSEAYLTDISSPLKALLPDYKALEARTEHASAIQLGVPFPDHPNVKEADLRMLMTEVRDIMTQRLINLDPDIKWPDYEPYKFKVRPWTPKRAKREFLDAYERLTK